MDSFQIAVDHSGVIHPFTIRPYIKKGNIEFEVLKFEKPLFILGCCTDKVGDTLKLIKGFAPVHADIVVKVAEILQSEDDWRR